MQKLLDNYIDSKFNNDYMFDLLYVNLINKNKTNFTDEEQTVYDEFQKLICDLVNYIRLQDNITELLLEADEINSKITDCIIMLWCTPTEHYHSDYVYELEYIKLISHMKKLYEIIDTKPIERFCLSILIGKRYIPVHCFDLLWYYYSDKEIGYKYVIRQNGYYVGIDCDQGNLILILNMNVLYDFGLGNTKNKINISYFDNMRSIINSSEYEQIKSSYKSFSNQITKLESLL
jgi:hypothetical protein